MSEKIKCGDMCKKGKDLCCYECTEIIGCKEKCPYTPAVCDNAVTLCDCCTKNKASKLLKIGESEYRLCEQCMIAYKWARIRIQKETATVGAMTESE